MTTPKHVLVLSDLHLGSVSCRVRYIIMLLEAILRGDLPMPDQIVLAGDVLDGLLGWQRLTRLHWRVLSLLRELSEKTIVIWVRGNHDYGAKRIAALIGARFEKKEYLFECGGRRILVVHGHRWDRFIRRFPWLTIAFDWLYLFSQRLTRPGAVAIKQYTLPVRWSVERVEKKATRYGRRKKVYAVICGHVHKAVIVAPRKRGWPIYCNTGSWADHRCHFLAIYEDGMMELREFTSSLVYRSSRTPV